jgi:SNF2 family DNA or RNA helicase
MQCRILTPMTVPERFTHFRDMTMLRMSQFKFKPKANAAETVFSCMRPAVRYTLDDIVELPEVIERPMDVFLSPRQKKVYDELRKMACSMIDNREITAANAAAVLSKMLQVSMGYVYTSSHDVVDLDPTHRLDALVDVINSTDRKVLVFSPFTHGLRGIAARLNKEKIESALIDGTIPQKIRGETFSLFQQTDKYKVLNCHPGTMAHGLTLTAADTIVWFGPTTSLEIFEQANARITRIGQKHKQQIVMFQSTPAEKRMYALLRSKQVIQDSILELFELNS